MSVDIKILLVEDNAADARLFAEALKGETTMDADLTVVKDGEEALDYLYKRGRHAGATRPHMIFLDLNLPKRSGHEVLEKIKSDEDLKRTPVVVLTTSRSPDDVNRSYELYANAYLTKPSDLEQFLKVMEAMSYLLTSVTKLPEPAQSAAAVPIGEGN